MVTRTVICISITSPEAAALAANESLSSAEADSIIKNAPTSTHSSNGNDKLKTYVELPVGFGIIRVQQRGGPTQTQHHTQSIHSSNENRGEKKRALPSPWGTGAAKKKKRQGTEKKKRQGTDGFVLDLVDVPPQQPIPKRPCYIKEGSSKYIGVYFNKPSNKWQARIKVEGKERYIGDYENEEEAAVDYARALFKYRGQHALDKAKRQKDDRFVLDLSDVPPQRPILKSRRRGKEGASKYAGIYFNKSANKWQSLIRIEGKGRSIGYYESEEEAAIAFARALFKYKSKKSSSSGSELAIDLSDVPSQPPIPKSKEQTKDGTSKYVGVTLDKRTNEWKAQISIYGKERCIGHYDNEEEAAVDYARIKFQSQSGYLQHKSKLQTEWNSSNIDSSDVPQQQQQPPIPKTDDYLKESSSSTCTSVSFERSANGSISRDNFLRSI